MDYRTSAKKFGANMRVARESKGITLREFADLVGKSPTFISSIERGQGATPSKQTAIEICKLLGLDLLQSIQLLGIYDLNDVAFDLAVANDLIRQSKYDAAQEHILATLSKVHSVQSRKEAQQ